MDGIKLKEEYDAQPDENFGMGNGDNNNDTNDKANIIQQDVGLIYVNIVMVLS